MQPEEIRRLERLQRQAAELGQLARDLAEAAPSTVEGIDATGWVLVVLGRDGIPTKIRVREGWRQRIEPERLASAVLDANSDAVRHAMQAWINTVDDGGWWRRRADFEENADEETASASQPLPKPPLGQARDSNELAEEALSRLHEAQTSQVASQSSELGQDDEKRVTIQIASGGLTACAIEPDWAKQHDGFSISAALSKALEQAVAARKSLPPPVLVSDALISDALATLASITASSPSEGGNR